jgi:hypothetical protein
LKDNPETKLATRLHLKTMKRKRAKPRDMTLLGTAFTKWRSNETPNKVVKQSLTAVVTLEPLILQWASV